MLNKIRTALPWTRKVGDTPPVKYQQDYQSYSQGFWEEWAQTFKESPTQQKIYPQHQWLLAKLEQLRPQSILEIGCGFGRNIGWLSKQLSYQPLFIGVDFSPTFIKQAHTYLSSVPNLELYTASLLNLPPTVTAEVVLVHGVFMHIPPQQLPENFSNLLQRSQKAILHIEEISSQPPLEQAINKYTFSHDYQALYATASGWQIAESFQGPHNLIWLYVTKQ